jgi:hypothetical protein
MGKLELKDKSYNFQIQENKLVPIPGNNEGGLASNIKKTTDNAWDKANFLKTHEDQRTKENVQALKECVIEMQSQAKKDSRTPKEIVQRLDKTYDLVNNLKAAA